MPDKSYYDPDGMSPQRKEEFDKWYNEKVSERYIFNFVARTVDVLSIRCKAVETGVHKV